MAEHTSATPRWPGDGKDFRVTMGLHICHPDSWLLRGSGADELIANKAKVLAASHDMAVAVLPEGDAAAREAAQTIFAEVARHTPDDAELFDPLLASHNEDQQHPLERVSRLIAEDVCVMTPHTAGDNGDVTEYRLTAAVLCAPSRWSLQEKLGTSLRTIHAPVPGYEGIAAPSDRFFDRLPVGDIMERTNWSVLGSPELFQPSSESDRHSIVDLVSRKELKTEGASALLAHRWLRLERQTLRKLPETAAVIFTILTTNTRLDDLAACEPQVALQLAHKIRTAPSDTRIYKGWPDADVMAEALEAACSVA